MEAKPTLLIVDDDELIQEALTVFFEDDFNIVSAMNRRDVTSALSQLSQPPDYALVDLGLPPAPHNPSEGFSVMSILQSEAPECVVVVVSGQEARRHGQRARALGAADYAEKPCAPQALLDKLQNARQHKVLRQSHHGIVGNSPPVNKLREQIALTAPLSYPVLIEGESGVGKELVARALHDTSRRGKPFLAVNCSAIPAHLVEQTLFGYVRGAYTGAARDSAGYLGAAGDGTLLLDEIGDLPDALQPKLLRVLEAGEYQRVGDTTVLQCPARVIAAYNPSNQRAPAAGEYGGGGLRDDLYYRLSVFTIAAPPLRKLGRDRLLLLQHYRDIVAQEQGSEPFQLTPAAEQLWMNYHFPGNVRELKNIVIRLQVKYSGGQPDAPELREEFCEDDVRGGGKIDDLPDSLIESRLASHLAAQTLRDCGGDAAAAAKKLAPTLDISEQALRKFLTTTTD